MLPCRNIELKARTSWLDSLRSQCSELAVFLANEQQTDTYFLCQRGRLKLREWRGLAAQLVAYERSDATTPRGSDYWLAPVSDPAALKSALTAALGVLIVVSKERDVFLHGNVRIHLDRVAGLGDFIEFEAVLSPGDDEQKAARLVEQLARRLGVDPDDRVEGSYSDLLLVKRRGGG